MHAGNRWLLGACAAALLVVTGCLRTPSLVPESQRVPLGRAIVETPPSFELVPHVKNLTAPTAIGFMPDGSLLVAESGPADREPKIFGFTPAGEYFQLYPSTKRFAIPFTPLKTGLRIYGPVGGIVAAHGKVYVSHRDAKGRGMITAFSADGTTQVIVADLPAEGDHAITDLAVHPNGRIYFGIGSMTNSGVVGLDNWQTGWVKDHVESHDLPHRQLKLLGYRFDSKNPRAGWFGSGGSIAVTAPFQPLGKSNQTRVQPPTNSRPTAAIYSVAPSGGDLRVEAFGIRYPRGLAFNDYGRLFITNNGMELRGTRPIANDPDVLLRFVPGTWYGWPDYTADLSPVWEEKHQPPTELISASGYPDVSFVIDHAASGLVRPDRSTLIHAPLGVQAGAAKVAFVPAKSQLSDYTGDVLIALSGDRAPFANAGEELPGVPAGYKVVRIDDSRQVSDFIVNVSQDPKSKTLRLYRPVDVKFSPAGELYVLDFGRASYKKGQPQVSKGTGVVYRLVTGR